jgi:hypothetical protein
VVDIFQDPVDIVAVVGNDFLQVRIGSGVDLIEGEADTFSDNLLTLPVWLTLIAGDDPLRMRLSQPHSPAGVFRR